MVPLTRESFLAANTLPIEEVHLPHPHNGVVWVRTLSGAERDAFEAAMVSKRGKSKDANLENIRARLVVLTVCDHAGNRLFKDEDAEAVGKQSAKVLDLIADVAQRLNGFKREDVDELAESLKNDPSGASGSN